MISRRKLFICAAAAAVVAPVAAKALPARLLDVAELPPPLDLIPCDGRALPIAQYLDLYKVISGVYGSDPVAQTFNVPDMRGRVLAAQEMARRCEPDVRVVIVPHIVARDGDLCAGMLLMKAVDHAPG